MVNGRGPSATNTSKPAKAFAIREDGVAVPTGLATKGPAAWMFVSQHGRVIAKSTSAARSVLQLVKAEEDFTAVEWCLTQFQAFVDGVEFRAHVVGGRVFAHRITSDAVDYRCCEA